MSIKLYVFHPEVLAKQYMD